MNSYFVEFNHPWMDGWKRGFINEALLQAHGMAPDKRDSFTNLLRNLT
jgi:hypothetical protein